MLITNRFKATTFFNLESKIRCVLSIDRNGPVSARGLFDEG